MDLSDEGYCKYDLFKKTGITDGLQTVRAGYLENLHSSMGLTHDQQKSKVLFGRPSGRYIKKKTTHISLWQQYAHVSASNVESVFHLTTMI